MDDRVRGIFAPLAGAGGLFSTQAAWFAEHPGWAFASLFVTVLTVLVPVMLFCGLARRVAAHALRRGTSAHLSYHGLHIDIGRNTSGHDSDADQQED